MTDYRRDLAFGLFPTPRADDPRALLELAQLADVLGMEHVSIQDHPYHPQLLDTWTLLSTLGARTSAIHLSTNVSSIAMRPPVVLAKSAATLDILTGGRIELGLGAGGAWDAMVAAGADRLTPRQAVDAVAEAVVLIRQLWDGGSVNHSGQYFRVAGLSAGPPPAHRIPIWIGGYKPRMLALTGRAADAWVPSLPYAGPEELAGMNSRIDDAALAAGRQPAEIRRIYNIVGTFGRGGHFLDGSAADWAEQLAQLALEKGMDTFILGTDNPDDLKRFAEEVVPATRQWVTAARTTPVESPAIPVRSRSAGRPLMPPTPDTGVRLTGELPWREQDRPVGDRPRDNVYPASQHVAPDLLVSVHNQLRKELRQIRDLVDQVGRGGLEPAAARSAINTLTVRQNTWMLGAYCESYCRLVTQHHTIEDNASFPHLRRADSTLGPLLDRLRYEQSVIHGVVDKLDRALVGMVTEAGTTDPAAAQLRLQQAVDLLTDTLLSHLSYEETELMDPLAQYNGW